MRINEALQLRQRLGRAESLRIRRRTPVSGRDLPKRGGKESGAALRAQKTRRRCIEDALEV